MKKESGADYWEHAGEIGHDQKKYASQNCAVHAETRMREIALDIATRLGLDRNSKVLDLGCGDGNFANQYLALHFGNVDGTDLTNSGINHANGVKAKSNMRFWQCNLIETDVSTFEKYDGVFLFGILHHIKQRAPETVKQLAAITGKVVVMEPNGNNILRKCLELTPSYRSAGEQSFTVREVETMFSSAGFRKVYEKTKMNPFSVVYPEWLFRLLLPFEDRIESTPLLKEICTVNMWGFTLEAQMRSATVSK